MKKQWRHQLDRNRMLKVKIFGSQTFIRRIPGIEDDEDDGMEDVDDNDGCENISDEEREEDYNGNVAIDQEDESALDMFMAPSGSPATSSLSVLVSKQLKEQEAKLAASQQRPHIDHRVVQVYKGYCYHCFYKLTEPALADC